MRTRGQRHASELAALPGCWRLELKADAPVVFCPLTLSRDTLCMLISEQLDPENWHYYQIPETRLRADDVVVDAGACEGLFTALAHRCKAVLCVEPSRACTPLLSRSFAAHPNIRIVPRFLGAARGLVQFTEAGADSRIVATGGYPVEVATLDALAAEMNLAPTYLKADLEGYELDFLRGAAETIRQNRPRIAITTYHVPTHATEITAMLRQWHPDYRIKCKGITATGCPVMLHAW